MSLNWHAKWAWASLKILFYNFIDFRVISKIYAKIFNNSQKKILKNATLISGKITSASVHQHIRMRKFNFFFKLCDHDIRQNQHQHQYICISTSTSWAWASAATLPLPPPPSSCSVSPAPRLTSGPAVYKPVLWIDSDGKTQEVRKADFRGKKSLWQRHESFKQRPKSFWQSTNSFWQRQNIYQNPDCKRHAVFSPLW